MAAEREKRQTAGSRMAKLLENEEEDTFYQNIMGSLNQNDSSDPDYESEPEPDDVSDSDISLPEPEQDESESAEELAVETNRNLSATRSLVSRQKCQMKEDHLLDVGISTSSNKKKDRKSEVQVRKSTRITTAAQSAEMKKKLQEKSNTKRQKKRREEPQEELTLAQYLEEAKITEQENLKSLEKYQKLELEKKRTQVAKKVSPGPMIRFISKTHIESNTNPEATEQRCERTYICFQEAKTFEAYFKEKTPKAKPPKISPFTSAPAPYFDPVTRQPYACVEEFQVLRRAYEKGLELMGNREDPEVSEWLNCRK